MKPTNSEKALAEKIFEQYYRTYNPRPGAELTKEQQELLSPLIDAAVDLAELILGRHA